jgi:hypothetical protein
MHAEAELAVTVREIAPISVPPPDRPLSWGVSLHKRRSEQIYHSPSPANPTKAGLTNRLFKLFS